MKRPVTVTPSSLPLGELLVKEGLLQPEMIDRIVRKQEQHASTGREHKLFGQYCMELKLLAKEQLQAVLIRYQKSIRIGELLVLHGWLTSKQLKQALEIQQQYPGHRLGHMLVEIGAINEDQLARALSQQLDVPRIKPSPLAQALDRLGSLDAEFVRQNLFCPVSEEEAGVVVAMADPHNEVLLDYLAQSFSRQVLPAIAGPGEIKSVIDAFYRKQGDAPAEAAFGTVPLVDDNQTQLRVTMLGPLEVPIDVQRELDKAGKTHGLEFMDAETYHNLTPRRGAEPPEPGEFKLSQQKTLIERWPFLLMDKEERAAEQAKRPDGPSVDEILRQKFGTTQEFSLTSTFILSAADAGRQLPASAGQASVDLKASMRYSGDVTAALNALKGKPDAAETMTPDEMPDTLFVGAIGLATGKSQFKQEESMLNYLFKTALGDQATAIYVEPQDKYLRVRYRIDGVLHQKTALPLNLGGPMLARLKQLCELDADNVSTPQRNRVQARFNERALELGVATYPSVWGESLALTFKYKQDAQHSATLPLDRIGLSPSHLRRLQALLSQPGGLLLVTGPARCGKTTTLYAACHYLNILSQLIVTAESPVEQTLPGILQGNWTPGSGGSFAELIQAMGFMSPEVMMVSELESPEAVKAGVELALGGAKLMTAYQSFDTMGALQRLTGLGLDSFLLASGQLALLSQRLVRQLCPHCKREDVPSRELLDRLGLPLVAPDAFVLYRPRGCEACHHLGYSGQLAIHELLVIGEPLRQALLSHQPAAILRELARSKGQLISMVEDGYYKAVEGLTSLAEVQRVAFINEYDAAVPQTAEQIVALCRGEPHPG